MDIAIAGGHGKIGQLVGRMLVERGDGARGLIREPDQAEDLRAAGIDPVLCDLEGDEDLAAAIDGCGAVVFAAGAGPGSSAERKWTVDHGGAVKLIEAAREVGARRYVMVSSMGADDPPEEGGEVFGEYLRAKAAADRDLEASGLDYTIVRPGGLTDDPPTGLVRVGNGLARGQVPRADVAAVLLAALTSANAIGKTFELFSGDQSITDAIDAL